jgi:hypothetical protein
MHVIPRVAARHRRERPVAHEAAGARRDQAAVVLA